MKQELIRLQLPADYVNARTVLRAPEIAYAYDWEWLSSEGIVKVSEHAMTNSQAVAPEVESLALLLTSDYSDVGELVAQIDRASDSDPTEVWLFLALSWVHDHREAFPDALSAVESLFADFGYPEEIAGLVRFMPPPEGQPMGLDAIEGRWTEYLQQRGTEFAARS